MPELAPDNPDHLAQLGQIHALQGDREAAHQVIARLKKLAGTTLRARLRSGARARRARGARCRIRVAAARLTDERYGPRRVPARRIPISTAFAATRVSMRLSRELVQGQGCRLAPGPASLIIHGEDWFWSVDLRLSVCTGGRAWSGAAECEYLSASSPLSAFSDHARRREERSRGYVAADTEHPAGYGE